jgi:hypothetical protein
MLDNGYVYLAASRLALYRSDNDWARVLEVFGHMPRAGWPDTTIYTFASRLHDRDPPEKWRNRQAYEQYLANNPHNEMRTIWPIEPGAWQDQEDEPEWVACGEKEVVVRGKAVRLPGPEEYARHGIDLQEPPRVRVFELCRYLAEVERQAVLATDTERRVSVPPELRQMLLLDDWHHPDLAAGERPGESETFQQLVRVLVTGDVTGYRPSEAPNTHWRNWPDGGTL